jgi:hypothetical protein
MPTSVPPISRGTVRQGGKEELRASVLKTYLLRVRTEKGERTARQLLAGAGIDPSAVDNETGWVSQVAAKRALRAISELLGRDAIRHRADWVTHPEALGVLVRMLRTSDKPLDAYRYLAQNAREATRVGTWEIEETGADKRKKPAAAQHVKLTYRPRTDGGDEPSENQDLEGEELLCDARAGELASMPRIWGLGDAEVTHSTCLAKGADCCVYDVRWTTKRSREGIVLGAAGASVACGAAMAATGGSRVRSRSRWASRSAAAPGTCGTARARSGPPGSSSATASRRSSAASSFAVSSARRPGTSPARSSAASTTSDARSARAASASSTPRSTSRSATRSR